MRRPVNHMVSQRNPEPPFPYRKEAQTIVEAFGQEYNNYRPHSSLGYLTPAEFARRYYGRSEEKQAIQLTEKAGSLSF